MRRARGARGAGGASGRARGSAIRLSSMRDPERTSSGAPGVAASPRPVETRRCGAEVARKSLVSTLTPNLSPRSVSTGAVAGTGGCSGATSGLNSSADATFMMPRHAPGRVIHTTIRLYGKAVTIKGLSSRQYVFHQYGYSGCLMLMAIMRIQNTPRVPTVAFECTNHDKLPIAVL